MALFQITVINYTGILYTGTYVKFWTQHILPPLKWNISIIMKGMELYRFIGTD